MYIFYILFVHYSLLFYISVLIFSISSCLIPLQFLSGSVVWYTLNVSSLILHSAFLWLLFSSICFIHLHFAHFSLCVTTTLIVRLSAWYDDCDIMLSISDFMSFSYIVFSSSFFMFLFCVMISYFYFCLVSCCY